MVFNKKNGKIFGVRFSKSEQKAVDREIMSQIAIMNTENSIELDAIILWCLHKEFGFGKERLLRFYNCYTEEMNKLNERYRDLDNDFVLENTHNLVDYGVDIISLYNDKNKKIR